MARRGCWGFTFESFPGGGFQAHAYTPIIAMGVSVMGPVVDRLYLCPIRAVGYDLLVSFDPVAYDGQSGLYRKHWYFPYFVIPGGRL